MTRRDLLARLVAAVEAIGTPHPARVAVDGPDAAGKTVLADELGDALAARGHTVIRASVDGFHRPREERYRRGPDSAEGYYEDSFDHDALEASLLVPLGPGGDLRYRTAVLDFRRDRPVRQRARPAPPDAILVVDGVFLLRPELRRHWDYAVFVDAAPEVTLRRALDRDLALFGSAAEVERRYRVRYLPAQALYEADASPRAAADVVVANDDPQAPRAAWRAAGEAASRRA
jgi:uridine kinase